MNFSSRTDWDLSENTLTTAVREARATGRELLDLTVSNPTACGFDYDARTLLQPLGAPGALRYEPDPLGMVHAREAVTQYYGDLGGSIPAKHICLTTSTSEAYSYLFRLLCNPGDEVLIARPSYPLFDFLARLDDVCLVEYPLLYDHGWDIDFYRLEAAITERTRAIIVVHPNNPTGNFASANERVRLKRLCAERGLALIVDEVFLEYALPNAGEPTFAADNTSALTFVLSGISKICGLPQMKLSWIAACGPDAQVEEAMARIEVIADTFLSVNAPTQYALPKWLAQRGGIQNQIRARMAANLATLEERLRGTRGNGLVLQGGWTAILRVSRHVKDKPFVEAALDHGVIVQPGEFYGLPEGRVVVSLLTPPEIWQRGLAQLPVD
ncbi:MAG TPA: pyridoxal phosphate-dependent aminotransferase [Acidobacteriaceae bacterium]|jgi:aspartate/methionine/tyrosine aminotransferase